MKNKESFKFRAQNAGSTTRYTIYEMDVIRFWRGTGPQTINFAVPNFSPVEMAVGQSYLIFPHEMINNEESPITGMQVAQLASGLSATANSIHIPVFLVRRP